MAIMKLFKVLYKAGRVEEQSSTKNDCGCEAFKDVLRWFERCRGVCSQSAPAGLTPQFVQYCTEMSGPSQATHRASAEHLRVLGAEEPRFGAKN
jgi:hypothetical protein